MTITFTSPIFGETRLPTVAERKAIDRFVRETPVAVFQAMNQKFNTLGLMLSIEEKSETH